MVSSQKYTKGEKNGNTRIYTARSSSHSSSFWSRDWFFCRKGNVMHKYGTLILYDSENMKVPTLQVSEYEIPRINIEDLVSSIKSRFKDTHYNFISFGKRYYGKNNSRNDRIDRHNKRLEGIGFTIVEKNAWIKSNTVLVDGKKVTYEYEDCDMDGEIIHSIHTLGKEYARVILVSGDSDMKPALDYIRDMYDVETWVVSHRENLSNAYRDYNTIGIAELLKYRRAK